MKIGNKEFKEILITDKKDRLIARITDDNIVEGIHGKATCIPGNAREPSSTAVLREQLEASVLNALDKQLSLLTEVSKNSTIVNLCSLTTAICEIHQLILRP